MHTCFGADINRAVMPVILKPLLAKSGLRRAAGNAGRIDAGGAPFPQHFSVERGWTGHEESPQLEHQDDRAELRVGRIGLSDGAPAKSRRQYHEKSHATDRVAVSDG